MPGLDQSQQAIVTQILNFWFGDPGSSSYGKRLDIWFNANPGFDALVRQNFLEMYQEAQAGHLSTLMASAEGCLALILLTDQFPRNMFRGQAQAFTTDSIAREVANFALDNDFDRKLLTVQRLFLYLPFEHSEKFEDQERSVALFVALGDSQSLTHAICHRDQILRFGRFPDRNNALGLASTPEEISFLQNPFCS